MSGHCLKMRLSSVLLWLVTDCKFKICAAMWPRIIWQINPEILIKQKIAEKILIENDLVLCFLGVNTSVIVNFYLPVFDAYWYLRWWLRKELQLKERRILLFLWIGNLVVLSLFTVLLVGWILKLYRGRNLIWFLRLSYVYILVFTF